MKFGTPSKPASGSPPAMFGGTSNNTYNNNLNKSVTSTTSLQAAGEGGATFGILQQPSIVTNDSMLEGGAGVGLVPSQLFNSSKVSNANTNTMMRSRLSYNAAEEPQGTLLGSLKILTGISLAYDKM